MLSIDRDGNTLMPSMTRPRSSLDPQPATRPNIPYCLMASDSQRTCRHHPIEATIPITGKTNAWQVEHLHKVQWHRNLRIFNDLMIAVNKSMILDHGIGDPRVIHLD